MKEEPPEREAAMAVMQQIARELDIVMEEECEVFSLPHIDVYEFV